MSAQINFVPAIEHLDLVCPAVASFLLDWQGRTPVDAIMVAAIDPAFAGGTELCDFYGLSPEFAANCVIVEFVRASTKGFAAAVVPVGRKADLNGIVRRHLGARRVSLAAVDEVLPLSGMEYGSITPIGLPPSWSILVDSTLAAAPRVIVGSGLLHSKLSLPGNALLELSDTASVLSLVRQLDAR